MAGIDSDRFVKVILLGRRVKAHLVAVPPEVSQFPAGQSEVSILNQSKVLPGHSIARNEQLGVDVVQIPFE